MLRQTIVRAVSITGFLGLSFYFYHNKTRLNEPMQYQIGVDSKNNIKTACVKNLDFITEPSNKNKFNDNFTKTYSKLTFDGRLCDVTYTCKFFERQDKVYDVTSVTNLRGPSSLDESGGLYVDIDLKTLNNDNFSLFYPRSTDQVQIVKNKYILPVNHEWLKKETSKSTLSNKIYVVDNNLLALCNETSKFILNLTFDDGNEICHEDIIIMLN